jgi:hypothetical protein
VRFENAKAALKCGFLVVQGCALPPESYVVSAPFLATSLRGALATKQSRPFLLLLDCFASLAVTWRDQASAAGLSTVLLSEATAGSKNEKHPSDYCQFASAASRKSGVTRPAVD